MYEINNCEKRAYHKDSYVDTICLYDISKNVINTKIIYPIQLFQSQFRRKLYRKRFNIVIKFVTTNVLAHIILSYL